MKKALAIFIIFGIIGLVLFIQFRDVAFPQASLQADITHSQAQNIASKYLESKGFDLNQYKGKTKFQVDILATAFLQKTLGVEGFNDAMIADKELAPWGYESRFFIPLEKKEFNVAIDIEGNVIGFNHIIEETQAGQSISKEEAQDIVLGFVKDVLVIDLDQYEQKSYSEEKLENRIDHNFVYELIGSQIPWTDQQDAEQGAKRLNITVQGDQIGSFITFVFVPETFVREYEKESSTGTLYSVVAFIGYAVFMIIAIVVLLKKYKADDIRAKLFFVFAFILGIVLILANLSVFNSLLFFYETSIPYATFIAINIVVLLIGLIIELLISLLIPGIVGESLTTEQFPKANSFSSDQIKTSSLIIIIKGISLALAGVGLQVLIYLVGSRFLDLWVPLGPEVTEYMSSVAPFLIPIMIGLSAAFAEEFMFRYFAISFFKKYVKSTFIAVLIPSIVWAFLHSTYPIFPMYFRGIELTIVGVIAGYIFLRHGIMVTITAHYFFNVLLGSIPLLLSSNLYLFVSGIIGLASIFIVIPILIWIARMYPRMIVKGIISSSNL